MNRILNPSSLIGDGRQQCSGCRRWSITNVFTLTDTKRPLIAAIGAATSDRLPRRSCRKALRRRLAVPATASARRELVLPTHC